MKIYHNPRCSKSRQTLEIIKSKKVDFEVVEYLKTPLNVAEIKDILRKLNMRATDIIRRSEPVYIEKFKGRKLTETQWIRALADNPILMERPIVINREKAIVGRPPENVKKLF